MKNNLLLVSVGDTVKLITIDSSGICNITNENIVEITSQYDEAGGYRYNVIWLKGGNKFDSRNGKSLTKNNQHIE